MPWDPPEIAEARRVATPVVAKAAVLRKQRLADAAEWRWANDEFFRIAPWTDVRNGADPVVRWQKRPSRHSVLHALDAAGQPILARRYANGVDGKDVCEVIPVRLDDKSYVVAVEIMASLVPAGADAKDPVALAGQPLTSITAARAAVYHLDRAGRVDWHVYPQTDGPGGEASIERTSYDAKGLPHRSVFESLVGPAKAHIRNTFTYHHDSAGKLIAIDNEYVVVDTGQVAERRTKKFK